MKVVVALLVALAPMVFLAARPAGEVCVGSYATSISDRTRSQKHNAMLALEHLNGTIIKPGEEFSFNRRVGSFSRDEGYRKAPVSYNGQLISGWGGGVCQTSTTLYNAALLAGMEVTERHRHWFSPGYVPPGRDAAVAFSNIDLRFRNPYSFPVRIKGRMENGRVVVGLYAARELPVKPEVFGVVQQVQEPGCYSIGSGGHSGRVRNTGKQGCYVTVFRATGGRKELISADDYPAMNRVVDYR